MDTMTVSKNQLGALFAALKAALDALAAMDPTGAMIGQIATSPQGDATPQPVPPAVPVPADPYSAAAAALNVDGTGKSYVPYVDPSVVLPLVGTPGGHTSSESPPVVANGQMDPNALGDRTRGSTPGYDWGWLLAIGVNPSYVPFLSQGMGRFPGSFTYWMAYRATQQGLDERSVVGKTWDAALRSWREADGSLCHGGPPDPAWDDVYRKLGKA